MSNPAMVRTASCRKVKPNRMASLRSTSAGTRARIGGSASRRDISAHLSAGDGPAGNGGTGRTHRTGTILGTGTSGGPGTAVVLDGPPARTGTRPGTVAPAGTAPARSPGTTLGTAGSRPWTGT